MKKVLLTLLAGSLLASSCAFGAVILAFDTTGAQGSSSVNSAFNESGLQASTVSLSSGLTAQVVLLGLSAGGGVDETTLAEAITAGDYFGFSITPDTGYKVSISDISLVSADNTGSDNARWALLTSVTGGFDGIEDQVGTTFAPENRQGEIGNFGDLSGVSGLQNVEGPIEVRLYIWGEEGNNANDHSIGYRNPNNPDANPAGTGSPYTIAQGYELVISGTVTPTAAPDTYADWASAHSVGAASADDDGDGLDNAVEYAYGLDPQTPNADSAARAGLGVPLVDTGSHLQFTYLRPATLPSDVTIQIRFSSDLVSWVDASSPVDYTSNVSGTDPLSVAVTLVPTIGTYKFAQVVYIVQ